MNQSHEAHLEPFEYDKMDSKMISFTFFCYILKFSFP